MVLSIEVHRQSWGWRSSCHSVSTEWSAIWSQVTRRRVCRLGLAWTFKPQSSLPVMHFIQKGHTTNKAILPNPSNLFKQFHFRINKHWHLWAYKDHSYSNHHIPVHPERAIIYCLLMKLFQNLQANLIVLLFMCTHNTPFPLCMCLLP